VNEEALARVGPHRQHKKKSSNKESKLFRRSADDSHSTETFYAAKAGFSELAILLFVLYIIVY